MIRQLGIALIVTMFAAALLYAHGAPLIGTVSAVGKDSITITDRTGKSIIVGFDNATKFLKDKKPAAMSDIAVGSRVVIDAHMDKKSNMYVAEEVQIGVATSEAKPATKAAPKKAPPKP